MYLCWRRLLASAYAVSSGSMDRTDIAIKGRGLMASQKRTVVRSAWVQGTAQYNSTRCDPRKLERGSDRLNMPPTDPRIVEDKHALDLT
ncbi:hypothetical protein SAMN04489806_0985 [Paramicrobacterium humi]|uniref:Uncharacterized protein n=1 Tax=Paramicrobacterium humi TaxID=640635 RepID=A0A1H4K3U1_9MICO|nr:hypothetical protein SAMN04489806_0985 [Microbacterium humi]